MINNIKMDTTQKINVAIIGVGSFAKALVEGVSFYTKNPDEIRGLLHPKVGNYHIKNIHFVCAFDVDERKVGKRLSEAIVMGANVTAKITSPIEFDALVYRGPTFDGVIEEMRDTFVQESMSPAVNIAEVLRETKTDIVVNLVPSGSNKATYFYAEEALKARCSFINCIPTPIATIDSWRERFLSKGLVLLGDDIKSQLGATMLNQFLLQLLKMRGVTITKTNQENLGGNADHFNLLYRSKHKEESKTKALQLFIDETHTKPSITFAYTGKPSGHKSATIKIEGEIFGRTPISITSTIEDEISINGAGTLVDAIRIAKLLIDRGKQERAIDACQFLMKTTFKDISDAEAFDTFNELINSCPD